MLWIKNARAVSGAAGLDECINLLVGDDGNIKKIEKCSSTDSSAVFSCDADIIDAAGFMLFPGFIDLHVHFREPGFTEKETVYTGSRASARGGFTTVVCMPNTKPALHSAEVLNELSEIIRRDAVVDVLPCGAITKDIAGIELADHAALVAAGAAAISDDGRTTMNPDYMLAAYASSARLGIPVMTHSEDHEITSKLGGASSPPQAENNIVERDIKLLTAGAHLHVCHVSTSGAIEAIRAGRAAGKNVTGEATPHHIALDLSVVDPADPISKVNPPIRELSDRLAVIEALRDGTLSCISTDHAPHEKESKEREFNKATMGISGEETAFSVVHTELVKNNGFSYTKLVELMCENPAKILGLGDRGILREGCLADLVLVDPNAEVVIDSAKFVSKGKNTPFNGRTYVGEVVCTIKRGKVVYRQGGESIADR